MCSRAGPPGPGAAAALLCVVALPWRALLPAAAQEQAAPARPGSRRLGGLHGSQKRHGSLPSKVTSSAGGDRHQVSHVTELEREVMDLKRRDAELTATHAVLVDTVQRALRTNQTQVLQKKINRIKRSKLLLASKSAEDRAALEAKVKTLETKLKQVNVSSDDARELSRSLQEKDLGLREKLDAAVTEVANLRRRISSLASEKQSVMETLQDALRQNSHYKTDLAAAKSAATTATDSRARRQSHTGSAGFATEIRGGRHLRSAGSMRLHNQRNPTVDLSMQGVRDPVKIMRATEEMMKYLMRPTLDKLTDAEEDVRSLPAAERSPDSGERTAEGSGSAAPKHAMVLSRWLGMEPRVLSKPEVEIPRSPLDALSPPIGPSRQEGEDDEQDQFMAATALLRRAKSDLDAIGPVAQ